MLLSKLGSSLTNLKDSVEKVAGDFKDKMQLSSTVFNVEGRRYRPKKLLGEGGYSSVFLVEDMDTGYEYAMKRMLLSQEKMGMAQSEIKIMNQLPPHKNLVRLVTSTIIRKPGSCEALLVMEFCSGGRMFEIIESRATTNKFFSEKVVWRIFSEICAAVEVMHSQNPPIAHRDLKIENVLVDNNGVCKLCDFGSATTETFLPKTNRERNIVADIVAAVATANIQPPEMIDLYRDQLINEKVDIWALGCVLYKLAFFIGPFDTTGNLAIINVRYTIPEKHDYSQELVDFIAFLLNPDPEKRPDIFKVLDRLAKITGNPAPARRQETSPPMATSPRSPGQTHRKTRSDASFFNAAQQKADLNVAAAATQPVLSTPQPQKSAPRTQANGSQPSIFEELEWFDPNTGNGTSSSPQTKTLQQQQAPTTSLLGGFSESPKPIAQNGRGTTPTPQQPKPQNNGSGSFFDLMDDLSPKTTTAFSHSNNNSPQPIQQLPHPKQSQSLPVTPSTSSTSLFDDPAFFGGPTTTTASPSPSIVAQQPQSSSLSTHHSINSDSSLDSGQKARRTRSHSRSRSDPSLTELLDPSNQASTAAASTQQSTSQSIAIDPTAKALIVDSWNAPNQRETSSKITDFYLKIARLPTKKDPAACLQSLISVHQLLHYGSPTVVSLSGSFIRTFEDLHSNWIARQKETSCGIVLAQYSYALVKKIQFGVAFPMFNGNFTVKPTAFLSPNPSILSAMFDLQACLLAVQDLLLQCLQGNDFLVDGLNILILDTYALAQAIGSLLAKLAVPSQTFANLYRNHDQLLKAIYEKAKPSNNLIPGGLIRLSFAEPQPQQTQSPQPQYQQPSPQRIHSSPITPQTTSVPAARSQSNDLLSF